MLKGTAVSDGIGIGKVMLVKQQKLVYTPNNVTDTDSEVSRFRAAVDKFCVNTKKKIDTLRKNAGDKESDIIQSHIQMIKDPNMSGEVEKLISDGKCAEAALEQICNMYIEIFSASEDDFLKQRTEDVRDIGSEVLSILLGIDKSKINVSQKNTVLVVKDLTPSMVAELDKENIVGIIAETGGKTSHSAILTRALEIPTILCVKDATKLLSEGSTVIVDGNRGIVINAPDSEMLRDYCEKRKEFIVEKTELEKLRGKETKSASGESYSLVCNIGNPDEALRVLECDGEGVGLFRTELLFMESSSLPTEDEQFIAYRKSALILKGAQLVIRTLDIGGDKNIPYLAHKKEENPFLGFRGIRYCLKNAEVFKSQLRAILRASIYGDVRIMFPLITCIDELREGKRLVEEAKAELKSQNVRFNENIKIGVMIETAAASLIADLLAKECDFFSIGTNDLISYTMACDRGNGDVSYLYSALQPSVLRSVSHIIECAKKNKIPVGVCGVAATNPLFIPLLISFGLNQFSVFPSSVLKVKKEISMWSKKEADKICDKAMSLSTEAEIRNYLNSVIKNKK